MRAGAAPSSGAGAGGGDIRGGGERAARPAGVGVQDPAAADAAAARVRGRAGAGRPSREGMGIRGARDQEQAAGDRHRRCDGVPIAGYLRGRRARRRERRARRRRRRQGVGRGGPATATGKRARAPVAGQRRRSPGVRARAKTSKAPQARRPRGDESAESRGWWDEPADERRRDETRTAHGDGPFVGCLRTIASPGGTNAIAHRTGVAVEAARRRTEPVVPRAAHAAAAAQGLARVQPARDGCVVVVVPLDRFFADERRLGLGRRRRRRRDARRIRRVRRRERRGQHGRGRRGGWRRRVGEVALEDGEKRGATARGGARRRGGAGRLPRAGAPVSTPRAPEIVPRRDRRRGCVGDCRANESIGYCRTTESIGSRKGVFGPWLDEDRRRGARVRCGGAPGMRSVRPRDGRTDPRRARRVPRLADARAEAAREFGARAGSVPRGEIARVDAFVRIFSSRFDRRDAPGAADGGGGAASAAQRGRRRRRRRRRLWRGGKHAGGVQEQGEGSRRSVRADPRDRGFEPGGFGRVRVARREGAGLVVHRQGRKHPLVRGADGVEAGPGGGGGRG